MRISDWSSDVCSSDLLFGDLPLRRAGNNRLRGTKDAERRSEVDAEHCLPLLVAGLLDHAVPGKTGIVDDDVNASDLSYRSHHDTPAETLRKHVASEPNEMGRGTGV